MVPSSIAVALAADIRMAAVVKLKYGNAERSTRLVNNQLHIPTIKDMFGLSSVDVDGVAEPADDRGFTFATYLSGSTLHISGSPAQAAVMSGIVVLRGAESTSESSAVGHGCAANALYRHLQHSVCNDNRCKDDVSLSNQECFTSQCGMLVSVTLVSKVH